MEYRGPDLYSFLPEPQVFNLLGHCLCSFEQWILCNLPERSQAISISNNYLVYFPWQDLQCLTHLNLSGNHLSILPPSITEFSPHLSLLDLSVNQITDLPDNFLNRAKARLYLKTNRLVVLNLQSLPSLRKNGNSFQVLILHGNPFIIDCNSELEVFLRTSNTHIPYLATAVQWGFPEPLQGQSVLTVDHRSYQEIYGGFSFLLSTFSTSAFIALPLLRHLYCLDVWYCLQILWAGCKGYLHPSASCSTKHYDAFMVFYTNNQAVRDLVYNKVVIRLESSGCVEDPLSVLRRGTGFLGVGARA